MRVGSDAVTRGGRRRRRRPRTSCAPTHRLLLPPHRQLLVRRQRGRPVPGRRVVLLDRTPCPGRVRSSGEACEGVRRAHGQVVAGAVHVRVLRGGHVRRGHRRCRRRGAPATAALRRPRAREREAQQRTLLDFVHLAVDVAAAAAAASHGRRRRRHACAATHLRWRCGGTGVEGSTASAGVAVAVHLRHVVRGKRKVIVNTKWGGGGGGGCGGGLSADIPPRQTTRARSVCVCVCVRFVWTKVARCRNTLIAERRTRVCVKRQGPEDFE